LTLYGKTDISYDAAKKLLMQSDFLNQCKTFTSSSNWPIPPKRAAKIKVFIDNPTIEPDALGKVSPAAKTLAVWLRAIDKYSQVEADMGPKTMELKLAQDDLDRAEAQVQGKVAELKQVQDRVGGLERDLELKSLEKSKLEQSRETTKAQLVRAEKLVSGLGSEEKRWMEVAGDLENDFKNLVGNVMLSAGCLAYIAPFNAVFRKQLIQEWNVVCDQQLNIPVDKKFDLIKVMAEPAEVRDWHINQLPRDEYSIENAIFVKHSNRWPLMIDPQGQANKWIKQQYKKDNLYVLKPSDEKFLMQLEVAIRAVRPVLLEDAAETFDPILDPLLGKQVQRSGGHLKIVLGGRDVEFSN